jgi:hypothetical protein
MDGRSISATARHVCATNTKRSIAENNPRGHRMRHRRNDLASDTDYPIIDKNKDMTRLAFCPLLLLVAIHGVTLAPL